MGDLDSSWLSVIFSKHSRDNSIVNVISVETEPAVGVGDNYSSEIVRATLKVILGSGKITTKKVVIKKILKDLPSELSNDSKNAFGLEADMYNNLLSIYSDMMIENNVPYNKMWPDCIFASHDQIILEDLKISGFTLGSRKTGLDVDHANVVIVNLARLHSLSLIAVANGLFNPKTLPPYMMIETEEGASFLKTAITALADVMRDNWTNEWLEIERSIRNMIANIQQIMADVYKQPHKLSVVNHGDCWVNNFMFKYSNGSPIEINFVDFQISYYNSYSWDLSYLFHTSIHPKYLISNYDSFIEVYCQEFSKNLERFGFDISKAPNVDEVKNEMIRMQPFSLAISCAVLPLTTNPSDIKLSLSDILNDVSKFRMLFEDKKFEIIMQDVLKHFIKLGLFKKPDI